MLNLNLNTTWLNSLPTCLFRELEQEVIIRRRVECWERVGKAKGKTRDNCDWIPTWLRSLLHFHGNVEQLDWERKHKGRIMQYSPLHHNLPQLEMLIFQKRMINAGARFLYPGWTPIYLSRGKWRCLAKRSHPMLQKVHNVASPTSSFCFIAVPL